MGTRSREQTSVGYERTLRTDLPIRASDGAAQRARCGGGARAGLVLARGHRLGGRRWPTRWASARQTPVAAVADCPVDRVPGHGGDGACCPLQVVAAIPAITRLRGVVRGGCLPLPRRHRLAGGRRRRHRVCVHQGDGGEGLGGREARRELVRPRSANIDVGAYHFFTLCRTGQEQAANFLPVVPINEAGLPAAVDLEFPKNCSQRPPIDVIHRELAVFLDTVEAATGHPVLLYVQDEFDDVYVTVSTGAST